MAAPVPNSTGRDGGFLTSSHVAGAAVVANVGDESRLGATGGLFSDLLRDWIMGNMFWAVPLL